MNNWIEWFTKNGVAANLLMVLVLVAGGMAMVNTKREVFPEFSLDMISISVPYLGAAPEEVEQGICIQIEEAIQGVDGVKRITSNAVEGAGTITVELLLGADSGKVLDEIKTKVDAIDTFPVEAERPIVSEPTNRRQVIDVVVSGDADERTLKVIAERLRDEISALPNITLVDPPKARAYEITIEVSEDDLRRYDMTMTEVSNAIRRSSLDIPGGTIKSEAGEILLRTKGQAYRGGEFRNLVLRTAADGSRILLGDVATVVDGFAESDQDTRFDGQSAVAISIYRVGNQDAPVVVDQVNAFLEEARKRMPEGITLSTWKDQAKLLNDRQDVLVRNGLQGLLLVFISLTLFLRFRLALWVSVGIPISFLGAFWVMPYMDVSINLISLFAFIVVLGIVVDDAIVVGENIYTHQTRHKDGMRGAIEGAKEVATPVTFGVLTTVAAFFPLMTVPGTMGKIMRLIPIIVISCLLFSWLESKFILPNHLSHIKHREKDKGNPWHRFQDLFYQNLLRVIEKVYKPVLEVALRWRYATVAFGVAILIMTGGLVAGGFVRFVFFPPVENDFITAKLTMPMGTTVENTSKALDVIEDGAEALRQELEKEYGMDLFRHVSIAIGTQPSSAEAQGRDANPNDRQSASHLGEITIELLPAEIRPNVSSEGIAQRWREQTGVVPDAVESSFSAALFAPGKQVDLQLTGPNLDDLRVAATRVKEELATYDGVYEIADTFREGKRELKLSIKPEAEIYGLTLADVGRQVRQAFYGDEAQRVQRGRDDIRVMVRYPRQNRESIGNLEGLMLRTPAGLEIPFHEVAAYTDGRGFSSIKRVDRRRAVNVTAGVDSAVVAESTIFAAINEQILPDILKDYPQVFASFEGQSAEQRDTMAGLKRGYMIAMVAIFILLAIPLKSYLQPLLIMAAIPFGLVGAIWGHMIMGMNLTILSGFGIVALAGVVVNDSLVLVDYINRHRDDRSDLLKAVRDAGAARFRPIILTSITTFVGLLPLLMEKSVQAAFLIPMAISLAFGVLFATFICLVLVPSGYLILEDLANLPAKIFKPEKKKVIITTEAPTDGLTA